MTAMVKLRVNIRVIQEDVYLQSQDGYPPPATSPQEKKFMVPIPNPQDWVIGQLAIQAKRQYHRIYRRDLGTIKYIKDEDDADLDMEMSVYDALVDSGRAAQDHLDQKVTIKFIEERGLPTREGSMVPDLSAAHYHVLPSARPAPPVRPPVPTPLWSQPESTLGKRRRELAFEEEDHPTSSGRQESVSRLRLAAVDRTEDADRLVPSLEGDTMFNVAGDSGLVMNPQEGLIQNSKQIYRRNTAISESPEPQPAFRSLPSGSVIELEVPEQAATAHHEPQQASSPELGESGGSGERIAAERNEHTSRQFPTYSSPVPVSRHSSGSRRSVAVGQEAASETLLNHPTATTYLQRQQQLPPWGSRANAPITPPSDTSFNEDARTAQVRLSRPASKSASSSIKPPSTITVYRHSIPRMNIYDPPESEIEDSQMSPRSRGSNGHRKAKQVTSTGTAKPSLSGEVAQLLDKNVEFSANKRDHSRPKVTYEFSGNLSSLSDADDHQLHAGQEVPGERPHDGNENQEGPNHILDNQVLSHELTLGDREITEEGHRASSGSASSRPQQEGRSQSQNATLGLTREDRRSTSRLNGALGEERHDSHQKAAQYKTKPQKSVLDTEMNESFPSGEHDAQAWDSLRQDERFDFVRVPNRSPNVPNASNVPHEAVIDILNGGSSTAVGVVTPSAEAKNDASVMGEPTKRRRKRRKSTVDYAASEDGVETSFLGSEKEREITAVGNVIARQAASGTAERNPKSVAPKSDGEITTSTEGAGGQLQQDLQMSMESSSDVADSYLSINSDPVPLDATPVAGDPAPILQKVYDGLVRRLDEHSASIELQGISGKPSAVLYRPASYQEPLATILSSGQMIRVKVNNISDSYIGLSMEDVDQINRGKLRGKQKKKHRKSLEPQDAVTLSQKDHKGENITQTSAGNNVAEERPKVRSKTPKAKAVARMAKSAKEAGRETVTDLNRAGDDQRKDTEVETAPEVIQVDSDDENPTEHRIGLGITASPRKLTKILTNHTETPSSVVNADGKTKKTTTKRRSDASKEAPSTLKAYREQELNLNEQIIKPRTDSNTSATRPSIAPTTQVSNPASSNNQSPPPILPKSRTVPLQADRVSSHENSHFSGDLPSPKVASSPASKPVIEDVLLVKGGEQAQLQWIERHVILPPSVTPADYLARRKCAPETRPKKARKSQVGELAPEEYATRTPKEATSAQKDTEKSVKPIVQKAKPATNSGKNTAISPVVDKKQTHKSTAKVKGTQPVLETAPAKPLPLKSKKAASKQNTKKMLAEGAAPDSQTTASPTPPVRSSPTPNRVSQSASSSTAITKSASKPKAPLTSKPQPAQPTPPARASANPSYTKPSLLTELAARRKAEMRAASRSSSSLLASNRLPATKPGAIRSTLQSESEYDESESGSDTDDADTQKAGAAAAAKTRTLLNAARPDPSIRDRSISVDDDGDVSDSA